MDADELYALAPEDFTAARTAAAKAARSDGDRELAAALTALRRPSLSAWLVNLVARRRVELLDQVLSLGPALAEAQASGRGDQLRALGEQRRALVEAVADAAVELAERPVTRAVREEVAGTFEAALADSASAAAVRSGRLVRALTYAGFGGVDLEDAVAEAPVVRGRQGRRGSTPPVADDAAGRRRGEPAARDGAGAHPVPAGDEPKDAPGSKRREAERRRALAAAEQAVLAASGRLDDAVSAAQRAERQRQTADEAVAAADRHVDAARAALEEAEQARAAAVVTRKDADQAAASAVQAVAQAQEAAEQGRRELDGLRRSTS